MTLKLFSFSSFLFSFLCRSLECLITFKPFHILLIIYLVDEISNPTKLPLFHPSIPLIFTHNNLTSPISYGSHDKQTSYILYHKVMNKKVTQLVKAMSKQRRKTKCMYHRQQVCHPLRFYLPQRTLPEGS